MNVQLIQGRPKGFVLSLTPEEKQTRKAAIDRITDQTMIRMTEFMPATAIVRADVRKTVAREYDKKIRDIVYKSLPQ